MLCLSIKSLYSFSILMLDKLTFRLVYLFSTLWLIYLIYTVIISFSDQRKMRQIHWYGAKNISSIYKGYKASIITRSYEHENLIIKRDYAFFGQGLNMCLSDVDRKKEIIDITFFVYKNDYQISNNTGRKPVAIPYFGLRKGESSAPPFLLWLDIWKFNYSKIIAFSILFCPLLLVLLFLKITGNKKYKLEDFDTKNRFINYTYILFALCLLINFLS